MDEKCRPITLVSGWEGQPVTRDTECDVNLTRREKPSGPNFKLLGEGHNSNAFPPLRISLKIMDKKISLVGSD